jgi:hypothetical protein
VVEPRQHRLRCSADPARAHPGANASPEFSTLRPSGSQLSIGLAPLLANCETATPLPIETGSRCVGRRLFGQARVPGCS